LKTTVHATYSILVWSVIKMQWLPLISNGCRYFLASNRANRLQINLLKEKQSATIKELANLLVKTKNKKLESAMKNDDRCLPNGNIWTPCPCGNIFWSPWGKQLINHIKLCFYLFFCDGLGDRMYCLYSIKILSLYVPIKHENPTCVWARLSMYIVSRHPSPDSAPYEKAALSIQSHSISSECLSWSKPPPLTDATFYFAHAFYSVSPCILLYLFFQTFTCDNRIFIKAFWEWLTLT